MAEIRYEMHYMSHPWDTKARADGMMAWVLCRVTYTGSHQVAYEPVAMFNLDSEGQMFQRFVESGGQVVADDNMRQQFATERVLDARQISPEAERAAVADNKKRGLR